MVECDYCGKNVTSYITMEYGKKMVCGNCSFLLDDKTYVGNKKLEYITKDGIIMWFDIINNKLFTTDVWVEEGHICVPRKVWKQCKDGMEIIDMLRQHKYYCIKCSKKIYKKEYSHFAGIYCNKCWDSYKQKYKRICLMCGQPEYKCCC